MQPPYYDTAGHIDYTGIKAYARQLRDEAVDAFWAGLMHRATSIFANLRRRAGIHVGASAIAHR